MCALIPGALIAEKMFDPNTIDETAPDCPGRPDAFRSINKRETLAVFCRSPMMRIAVIAIEIREPGNPDVLTPVERPRPVVAPDDVLIKVRAAGVNYPDVMQRQGKYPAPAGASDLPGLEVAGTIEEIGKDVHGLERGRLGVCAGSRRRLC